jgi:hypothetical protein
MGNRHSLITAIVLIVSFPAAATITDHGQYTYDSETGLYWLDVTITQGLTYTEVNQRLAPGGTLENYRYANHAELETLLQHFGIPPQGNTCYASSIGGTLPLYCDDVDAAYAELIEDVIRTLGDTEAAILNPNPFNEDVSPDGAGMTRGIILAAPGTNVAGGRGTVWIEDGEYVYGPGNNNPAAGEPYADRTDEIRSLYPNGPAIIDGFGSFLVSTTEPTLPIVIDLDPVPPPAVPAGGVVLFDGLSPDALGLGIHCEPQYSPGPCGYNADGFTASNTEDYGGNIYAGVFNLYKNGIDDQANPWMRIVGFDISGVTTNGNCSTSADLIHPGTLATAADLSLYEGGNGYCRFELTDVDYSFLPAVSGVNYIPGSVIQDPYIAYVPPYALFQLDNVVVEFLRPNMEILFDRWRNSELFPTQAYSAAVELLTTSVAMGDSVDFDVTQVDPSTLVLGPGLAPNVAAPIMYDVDGDGDMDMAVGFRIENSGLDCLDTEVSVMGRTLAGDPLFGRAAVTTTDCAKTLDMDVDPYNATNEIRPDDDYVVLVSVKSTSTAAGEASDLDALQIDPASLRFGPAGASNAISPIPADLDGDSDTDVIFGFQVQESGIFCGDTEVTLEGEQYDGYPLTGVDNITTTDCTETSCHP